MDFGGLAPSRRPLDRRLARGAAPGRDVAAGVLEDAVRRVDVLEAPARVLPPLVVVDDAHAPEQVLHDARVRGLVEEVGALERVGRHVEEEARTVAPRVAEVEAVVLLALARRARRL